MLDTFKATLQIGARWDALQQPVHGSARASDHLRLLAALDEGWQIVEAADMLTHGKNADGHSYRLILSNPRRLATCEWNVTRSPEVDALLAHELTPMAR